MAKANITLQNGTKVEIEGTPEEVKHLLEFYGEGSKLPKTKKKKSQPDSSKSKRSKTTEEQADLSNIVNLVKSCEEAEAIESQILDRISQVDRTLLPLYIVHEYLENKYQLTSGDISKVTTDLGIPLSTANVSHTLSTTASRYVIGDKVRKKGQPVRYKLSRRGVQYLKNLIQGSSSGE